jgi:2-aminoethylphosphonate-pyruvate transaminase
MPDPTTRRAVILAAGSGERLRSVVDDRPKGLVEIDGETLVARSVRLLRAAGIDAITIVAGYRADDYSRFAAGPCDIRIVLNNCFATTGSMASLDVGLAAVDGDVLIVESDIVYEPRALTAILAAPDRDATLVSGPTAAGDEVWVSASGGRVRAMSKDRAGMVDIAGEFVGLTRLSPAGCAAMRETYARFVREHGHGRMSYDTDALATISATTPIAPVVVPDLCWGEIDDECQLQRVIGLIRGPLRSPAPS